MRTWERWLKQGKECPPAAAAQDGIFGRVLAWRWNPPDGYIGRWDARPQIREHPEQDSPSSKGSEDAKFALGY